MNLLNNVGKKLGKTAKSVTKKSEELVEITKINRALGNEEDKINRLFIEIGTDLYNRFVNGESFDESLNEKFNEIKAVEDSIEALRTRVKNIKEQNISSDTDKKAEEE